MPNLTLRDIPDDVYERLREEADRNHRSLNREIVHRLERSIRAPVVDVEQYLGEVDVLLERATVLPYLTDERIRAARDEGRV